MIRCFPFKFELAPLPDLAPPAPACRDWQWWPLRHQQWMTRLLQCSSSPALSGSWLTELSWDWPPSPHRCVHLSLPFGQLPSPPRGRQSKRGAAREPRRQQEGLLPPAPTPGTSEQPHGNVHHEAPEHDEAAVPGDRLPTLSMSAFCEPTQWMSPLTMRLPEISRDPVRKNTPASAAAGPTVGANCRGVNSADVIGQGKSWPLSL